MVTSEVYLQAAQRIGLLSLSLISSSSQETIELPSWVPDWSGSRKRLLLDHPRSFFSASQRPMQLIEIVSNGGILSHPGLQLDVIKATSSYLPPRRHCDHYNVTGGNTIIFDEWFVFASQLRRPGQAKGSNVNVLLEYADTIQARGCNSIWEPTILPTPELLEKQMRDFLRFIDDKEMEATIEIRLFYAACLPSHDRRFGVTERGHFCLVPQDAKRGDMVCVLHGKKVPVIFRKVENHHQNIGEAYVNGLMQYNPTIYDSMEEIMFEVV
jgi:hypothetical protein